MQSIKFNVNMLLQELATDLRFGTGQSAHLVHAQREKPQKHAITYIHAKLMVVINIMTDCPSVKLKD